MSKIQNLNIDKIHHLDKVRVAIGYDSIENSILLNADDSTKLPDPLINGPYDLVWWNSSDYINPLEDPNVEIVKCIAKVGNAVMVIRDGSSNKNMSGKVYSMTPVSTDNVVNYLSYYNIPQLHGASAHTGTIGTWANIDKSTSSIGDITSNSHTLLSDIGINTHATIDTHLSDANNPHSTTAAQVGAPALVASSVVGNFVSFSSATGLQEDSGISTSAFETSGSVGAHAALTTAHGSSGAILGVTTANATYAPIANGVTNGNSHDHLGGDGGTIAYTSLSGIPSTFVPTSHGNTSHSSAFVTQTEINTSISTHAGISASVHGVSSSGFEDKVNKNAISGYAGIGTDGFVSIAKFQPIKIVTTTQAITADDYTIICNPAAPITVTLPTPVTGRIYVIKNVSAFAVTVATTTGTIDGASTRSLGYVNEAITVHGYSSPTIWYVI